METYPRPESEIRNSKIRRILGYILPFVDPVVDERLVFPETRPTNVLETTRRSGRIERYTVGFIPSVPIGFQNEDHGD